MIKYLIRFLTCWIPVKKVRKKTRVKLNKYFYRYTIQFKNELSIIKKALDTHDYGFAMVTIEWDVALYQRPQHFACQFSSQNVPVFYSFFNDKKSNIQVPENVFFISPYTLFCLPKCYAEKIYLIVTNIQSFMDFNALIRMKKLGYNIVYDYIDDFSEKILGHNNIQLEIFNHLEEIKPVLIMASAKNLYNQMVERFGRERVLFIPNGVEIENFLNIDLKFVPDDLQSIKNKKKPIVGYYGAMAPWLDWKLINEMHQKCKEYEFVYIGIDYQKALKNLEFTDNVHFLGAKKYNELPSYSIHFDCCIIPFVEGNIAKSTSPLKLFEYMAVKKPIVCTRDLLECSGYEGVFISIDHNEFIKNLKHAIECEKNIECQKKLFGYALANTWNSRAKNLVEKINDIKKY